MRQNDPLDQILLGFPEEGPFSIRDAFEGVQIFGSVGSGKTSCSGALFARSYLAAGYGGLVLTAKVDETDLWRRYAKETGREHDLVIIGPDAKERFNFLEYEANHQDAAGLTDNVVRLYKTISDCMQSNTPTGRSDDPFWENEFNKLLRNAIDLLRFAKEPITLDNIENVVLSAPLSVSEAESDRWKNDSYNYRILLKANARDDASELSPAEKHDYLQTASYWTRFFPKQPDKTRASVLSIFTGISDVFLRGILYQIFGTTTTVTPEASFDGKIIVLDLPEKRFNETGVAAQVLFKYCWQRVVEKRHVDSHARPVFLWMDESQLFVNKHDSRFQTTARSARVATVFLTQNIPNYYAALGGESASKAFVDSLLGNMATKVFHNNSCAVTNQYAAELFAREWQTTHSTTVSGESFSSTQQKQLEYSVLPREFSLLATGGPSNGFQVEGIVYRGGRVFNCSGRNALVAIFSQTQTP